MSDIPVMVELETGDGAFVVEVYPDRAPLSAGNFLSYVDQGLLDGTSLFRITTLSNEHHKDVPIEVIQFGWRSGPDAGPPPLAPIAHEPTTATGLKHVQWTVSTARFDVGTGGYGFFVCMRDEPELDFDGRRQPDGQGFAAFGRVVSGFDTLVRIFARAGAQHLLTHPVPIHSARRREAAQISCAPPWQHGATGSASRGKYTAVCVTYSQILNQNRKEE